MDVGCRRDQKWGSSSDTWKTSLPTRGSSVGVVETEDPGRLCPRETGRVEGGIRGPRGTKCARGRTGGKTGGMDWESGDEKEGGPCL